MFIMGERKLCRALQLSKNSGNAEAVAFRRGNTTGKVIVEPYKDVIGITLSMYYNSLPEVIEESYVDVEEGENKTATVLAIQKALPKMFRMCEIGLYVAYNVWENPMPKEVTIEEIAEYFNINPQRLQEARREEYKHGKYKVSVEGTYYGKKEITFLQSKKTKYITHIIGIK